MSRVFLHELIGKQIALLESGLDISADEYWAPQVAGVKNGYTLRAARIVKELQVAGYRILSTGDLDDLLDAAREEAYERGRIDGIDEHELGCG